MGSLQAMQQFQLRVQNSSPENELAIIRTYLPDLFLVFPELVKRYAKKIIQQGQELDCWHFSTLSNGGFFYHAVNIQTFLPHSRNFLLVSIPFGNGYVGIMDAESVGIVATIYALDSLAFHHSQLQLIDAINALLDYAKLSRFGTEIEKAIQ
jgi:hypothetical protein